MDYCEILIKTTVRNTLESIGRSRWYVDVYRVRGIQEVEVETDPQDLTIRVKIPDHFDSDQISYRLPFLRSFLTMKFTQPRRTIG